LLYEILSGEFLFGNCDWTQLFVLLAGTPFTLPLLKMQLSLASLSDTSALGSFQQMMTDTLQQQPEDRLSVNQVLQACSRLRQLMQVEYEVRPATYRNVLQSSEPPDSVKAVDNSTEDQLYTSHTLSELVRIHSTSCHLPGSLVHVCIEPLGGLGSGLAGCSALGFSRCCCCEVQAPQLKESMKKLSFTIFDHRASTHPDPESNVSVHECVNVQDLDMHDVHGDGSIVKFLREVRCHHTKNELLCVLVTVHAGLDDVESESTTAPSRVNLSCARQTRILAWSVLGATMILTNYTPIHKDISVNVVWAWSILRSVLGTSCDANEESAIASLMSKIANKAILNE
jgi:hypothetical protein